MPGGHAQARTGDWLLKGSQGRGGGGGYRVFEGPLEKLCSRFGEGITARQR